MSDLKQLFREKAELVAAKVTSIKSMDEAYAYAAKYVAEKNPCELLIPSSPNTPQPEFAAEKIMAAPELSDEQYAALEKECEANNVKLIKSGMRDYMAGIDAGFTIANAGFVETGSIVQQSNGEELRLATMVSEAHIAVLSASTIYEDSIAAEKLLLELMSGVAYTAVITGPSRTADIERTLAIGAHGPLELHILLLED
ncbi:lactate utilization protein [Halodesulfovibrio sp.]|jgi:L-lactate dehydrogenase complex protein LldG|uniref:lactate utilization protein n=1 Tax=Halodesulfovibrio sp. TaxID=1912772 RepID=UPI0025DE6FF1|nr:lactate utilization protein [Halodesulfovibrio sp.]MCT4535637.1 lactate utilization protein [Halodesulfovibrio sp.]